MLTDNNLYVIMELTLCNAFNLNNLRITMCKTVYCTFSSIEYVEAELGDLTDFNISANNVTNSKILIKYLRLSPLILYYCTDSGTIFPHKPQLFDIMTIITPILIESAESL